LPRKAPPAGSAPSPVTGICTTWAPFFTGSGGREARRPHTKGGRSGQRRGGSGQRGADPARGARIRLAEELAEAVERRSRAAARRSSAPHAGPDPTRSVLHLQHRAQHDSSSGSTSR
jgi:hypothetical protein